MDDQPLVAAARTGEFQIMTRLQVAVLGIGGMGKGIAGRLIDAGHEVTVYNRTAAAADELVARGAKRATSPAEAVRPGGIAITMLANDAAVDEVAGGFLETLGAGGLHISMSTITPALGQALAAKSRALGGEFLGSPVFGRPDAAAAGKLWIALSGSDAAKARAKPVHDAVSQGIFDFGAAPEAALVAKIGGNFLIAAAMESMGEAFALMAKSGVDERRFHEMISKTLFSCIIYQNYGRYILDQSFDPPGFKLRLGAKDVGLALSHGGATDTPLPIASLLRDRFLSAIAKGRGEIDWAAISLGAREDAGLPK
jgi:3-hydroxyisobutyrate dehydrogenase-like beta-hydroxyacid dehydrogenase